MTFSMKFSESCSSIKLKDSILTFKLDEGSTQEIQKIDLNQVLGVDPFGNFVWGGTNFSRRAQLNSIKLEGDNILFAKLPVSSSNAFAPARFNLDHHLKYTDGRVEATQLPAAIAVKGRDALDKAASELSARLRSKPNLIVNKVEGGDATFWRIGTETGTNTDEVFTTLTKEATAVFLTAVSNTGRKIETLNIEVLKAKASVEIGYVGNLPIPVPTYVGAGTGLNLFVAQASVFDVEFGISVGASLGWKDASWETEVASCGLVIGRRIGIAFLGAKVAVDLARFF